MTYADPQQRREYHRDYKRLKRAGSCQTPGQTLVPTEFRLSTAREILNVVAEQIAAVREDPDAGTLEKARTVGYLAGVALKAVEVADLSARVEAVERMFKMRKDAQTCREETSSDNSAN